LLRTVLGTQSKYSAQYKSRLSQCLSKSGSVFGGRPAGKNHGCAEFVELDTEECSIILIGKLFIFHKNGTENYSGTGYLMRKRTVFNPKPRIRRDLDPNYLKSLAESVDYAGNPEHKINPGDFGLTPPSLPQADKTKCDIVKVFLRKEAIRLLKEGVRKGLISDQVRNGYPQNIWAVTKDGWPMEAQLENPQRGTYHGYPMTEADPFHEEVLAKWKKL